MPEDGAQGLAARTHLAGHDDETGADAPHPHVAIVLKGYPRLSETFIAQELKGLEERGIRFDIWSLRKPYDPFFHPVHEQIAAKVRYLPEYLTDDPVRVFASVLGLLFRGGFWEAVSTFLGDLTTDFSRNRFRRFGQACVFAFERPDPLDLIYAHFLHTPSSVARYAAMIRGCYWGFSAHARDIWTTPEWDKKHKLQSALFGVTCTRAAGRHLNALAGDRPVSVVYHGLDVSEFPPPPERNARTGASEAEPIRFTAIGRAVEKKGLDVLIDALSDLPKSLHWRLVHIGDGPLLDDLRQRADRMGVGARIEWRGKQDREGVIAALRDTDIFVMPSRIAADGDRDGLPNVILEAATQALPIVASRLAGIAEFVEDKHSGVLVRPGNPGVLTEALQHLARSPDTRYALGARARRRLLDEFKAEEGVDAVARAIRKALGDPR